MKPIKPQELRIGNYIYRRDLVGGEKRIEQVLEIGKKVLTTGPINVLCEYQDLKRVELTEEILLRLGFPWSIRHQANANDDFWGKFVECYPKEKGYNLVMKKDHFLLIPEIRYLHEFQNIMYDFGFKELELKPKE